MSNRSLTKHLSSLEWKPLENEIVRINFDAVFNHRHFRSAVGLVVRNDRAEVLVFKSVVENRIASSFATEACTYAHAVRLGLKRKEEFYLERSVPFYTVALLGLGRQRERELDCESQRSFILSEKKIKDFDENCSTASDENVKMGMSKPTSLENLVIHKCKSRCLELDEALGFFNSMISMRPLPSISAFNYLLGAVSKMEHCIFCFHV
ncbi:hypothetical protein Gohar_026860 [Gossypium harknessii]|uniref:Pentatricopeptide repeat-containing protein n=1 Tax=Gossypium harknessii TaxID=34285 RepID=A0A7J9HT07_9ROSI|nr:hypothetical protein [Gossypium harknessii]